MKRRIITIDKEKCDGCGLCVDACHEGAIGMENGKAILLRDDYCDGLGDCLPVCPVDAISFEEREAAAFDAQAVQARQRAHRLPMGGCPGVNAHAIERGKRGAPAPKEAVLSMESELINWPVQIKLAPVNAPYFDGAKLLIAADCTAFAYGDFHNRFMHDHITLIGCPKLDSVDYSEKLAEIIRQNDIASVTVVRMEVPCCGGMVQAVKQALVNSGKMIPWHVVVVSTDGRIISEE